MNVEPISKMIGWNWLRNATRWHYFEADGKSLCRRWLALQLTDAPRTDLAEADRCASCDRALDLRTKVKRPRYVACTGATDGRHRFERIKHNAFEKCMLCGEPRFALVARPADGSRP